MAAKELQPLCEEVQLMTFCSHQIATAPGKLLGQPMQNLTLLHECCRCTADQLFPGLVYRYRKIVELLNQKVRQLTRCYCILERHHLANRFVGRVSYTRQHRDGEDRYRFGQRIVVVTG